MEYPERRKLRSEIKHYTTKKLIILAARNRRRIMRRAYMLEAERLLTENQNQTDRIAAAVQVVMQCIST